MLEIHPDAELAPRDVVARAIAEVMAEQDGHPVLLDATGLRETRKKTAAFLSRRFPTIDAAVRARGLDWSTSPIPVTPAAHYLMGGVTTDLDGRTSLPGLYAVGEVARTGVHGANRLASNSLLEGAVFGARAGDAIAADAASGIWPGRWFRPGCGGSRGGRGCGGRAGRAPVHPRGPAGADVAGRGPRPGRGRTPPRRRDARRLARPAAGLSPSQYEDENSSSSRPPSSPRRRRGRTRSARTPAATTAGSTPMASGIRSDLTTATSPGLTSPGFPPDLTSDASPGIALRERSTPSGDVSAQPGPDDESALLSQHPARLEEAR
jgi:hypothetical protein